MDIFFYDQFKSAHVISTAPYLHGWIQSSSSDFQKSLKCFQTCVYFSVRFFLVAQEIKYPSYCSTYYETKQRKKASNIVIPNEFDESLFARYRPLSNFREQHEKIRRLRPDNICAQWVGLDGLWIFSQITQNPLLLARNTRIVLRTTQTRL